MAKTSIEWTDSVWNCVRGCSMAKGSETGGCLNCYAARMYARNIPELRSPTTAKPFAHITSSGPRWTGAVELIAHKLYEPLHWHKPRKIFVNSVSDLFHEELSFYQIDRVFSVMIAANWHTYQILTKRPQRMLEYFNSGRRDDGDGPDRATYHMDSNIWLAVSVENQATADARIPLLLRTPAAVRFVSYEPALGPIDIGDYCGHHLGCGHYDNSVCFCDTKGKLDWVIAGGESGPGARPAHPGWFRSVRDQCQAAGVPFFFKQWGEYQNGSASYNDTVIVLNDGRFKSSTEFRRDTKNRWHEFNPCLMAKVGKKAAGAMLDGREWREFPQLKPSPL